MKQKITNCRACNSNELTELFVIKNVTMMGIFPKTTKQNLIRNDMILVKCDGKCGLVQLAQTPSPSEMYGKEYGYRSGLNVTMVKHLKQIVENAAILVNLTQDDCVLDIGSNDATLLNHYEQKGIKKVGFDPSAEKFKTYYNDDTQLVVDFFSAKSFELVSQSKPKVVTSIAMFYDLPNPLMFVQDISKVLHQNGIWIFEQSYLFDMLKTNSFDTICQEHLEYYSLSSIKWMMDKADLKIVDIEFNATNGGSIRIIGAHKSNSDFQEYGNLKNLLKWENTKNLITEFEVFSKNIEVIKSQLNSLIKNTISEGGKVFGLGASTKGNTLIQHFNLTNTEITSIGEVNSDKIGRFTPGSNIPIVSENEVLEKMENKDIAIVFPWHFEEFFTLNEKFKGKRLVFPLPKLH